jgi:hypothetical protein
VNNDRFSDWTPGEVEITNPVQCEACKRYRGDTTCSAFPDGIPVVILQNKHDHRAHYPGDHGTRFEPIDAEAARIVDEMFDRKGR